MKFYIPLQYTIAKNMKKDSFIDNCLSFGLLSIFPTIILGIIVLFNIGDIMLTIAEYKIHGKCIILLLFIICLGISILSLHHSRLTEKVESKLKELDNTEKQRNSDFEKKCSDYDMEIISIKNELQKQENALNLKISNKTKLLDTREEMIKQLLSSSDPFGKVASWYSDAVGHIFNKTISYLINKSHPAKSAAETIKEYKVIAMEYSKESRLYKYKYELFLSYMPNIEKIEDDDGMLEIAEDYYKNQNAEEEKYDRVKDWITKKEYESLSENERNQLALNKYLKSHTKSKWQIGRDYEIYCCHWLKNKGYKTENNGAMGVEDLGRDIIAYKGFERIIIQCKYWSKTKLIREKYIMQLYGTMVEYGLTHPEFNQPTGLFITNIELSDMAKKFANHLNIKYVKLPMGEYPVIKCNINNGNKIYHLPFDQQYDRTQICLPGEFFAWNVEEAVNAGFRRAFKHNFHLDKS